ncbi:MAG: anti-sigma factor [Acidimicrobiia bacterium]
MNRSDELIALAALGELDAAGQVELDAAVRRDPSVAPALHDALEAAARLQATGAVAPPGALRARVLGAVASTPQEPAPAPPGRAPDDHGRAVVPLVRRRAGWLAAAAAAVALIVGGVALSARQPSAPDEVAAVVDADDVVVRVLQGSLGGRLEVVHSGSQDALVVIGDDLAPLASDRTLQLWLVDDAGATSVGTFAPDGDGTVRARFDGVDPTGVVVGVTVEPAGGSAAPTLPIVASA